LDVLLGIHALIICEGDVNAIKTRTRARE
jgi:hypothetical protein